LRTKFREEGPPLGGRGLPVRINARISQDLAITKRKENQPGMTLERSFPSSRRSKGESLFLERKIGKLQYDLFLAKVRKRLSPKGGTFI